MRIGNSGIIHQNIQCSPTGDRFFDCPSTEVASTPANSSSRNRALIPVISSMTCFRGMVFPLGLGAAGRRWVRWGPRPNTSAREGSISGAAVLQMGLRYGIKKSSVERALLWAKCPLSCQLGGGKTAEWHCDGVERSRSDFRR